MATRICSSLMPRSGSGVGVGVGVAFGSTVGSGSGVDVGSGVGVAVGGSGVAVTTGVSSLIAIGTTGSLQLEAINTKNSAVATATTL